MTIWRRAAAVGALCSAMMTTTLPAQAQQLTLTDPSGDASTPGLDITSVQIRNGDHRFVAVVGFDRIVRGDLIVSVKARGGPGVRIVSERRADGEEETYVIRGHFGASGGDVETACERGSAVWDEKARTATLSFPARCLAGGDYGAIRAAVLTERRGDTDWAPERRNGEIGSTRWIARG